MTTANSHNSSSNNSHGDLDATKARMLSASSKIRDGVKDMVGETKNLAHVGQEYAQESLTEGVHKVQEKSNEFMCALEKTVKNKPMKSIAIAAGVGLLFGFILKRGR